MDSFQALLRDLSLSIKIYYLFLRGAEPRDSTFWLSNPEKDLTLNTVVEVHKQSLIFLNIDFVLEILIELYADPGI